MKKEILELIGFTEYQCIHCQEWIPIKHPLDTPCPECGKVMRTDARTMIRARKGAFVEEEQ